MFKVQLIAQAFIRPDLLHRPHHARRAAEESLCFGVIRHGIEQLFAAEQTLQFAAGFAIGADQFNVEVLRVDHRQFIGVDLVAGGIGVMQESDAALVAFIAERAQHRHHRRDAAAAADQQDAIRALLRQRELAFGLRQDHGGAHLQVLLEVFGNKAAGVGLGGEFDQAVLAVHRVGGRVAAGAAHAVDLDRQAHVLAGGKALPVAVGAQAQGDAVGGLVADGHDLGADFAEGPGRGELFHVAVDAVRIGQRRGEARVERAVHKVQCSFCVGLCGDLVHDRLQLR